MAIIRKHHVGNYTVVDNGFIRDVTISLKAKGIMLILLSLPDDWVFTEPWLVSQCSDGMTAVRSALSELEHHGYLHRERVRHEGGTLGDSVSDIYEEPNLDFLNLENRTLLNTDITDNSVIDKPNTKNTNNAKTIKHRFGEYGHVLLTDDDVEKLKAKFPTDWEQRIKTLDEGIELKGYKYKNYYLAILSWAKKDAPKETQSKRGLREG